eukprot:UN25817
MGVRCGVSRGQIFRIALFVCKSWSNCRRSEFSPPFSWRKRRYFGRLWYGSYFRLWSPWPWPPYPFLFDFKIGIRALLLRRFPRKKDLGKVNFGYNQINDIPIKMDRTRRWT